jgi:hypothetical protein
LVIEYENPVPTAEILTVITEGMLANVGGLVELRM